MKRSCLFLMAVCLLFLSGCREPVEAAQQQGIIDKYTAVRHYIDEELTEFDFIELTDEDGGVVGCYYNPRILSEEQTLIYGFRIQDHMEDVDFYYIRLFQISLWSEYQQYHEITNAMYTISKQTGAIEEYNWLGLGELELH